MPTTDHQLAEGVCESIAHTTPGFRPPSRAMGLMRLLVGWTIATACIVAGATVALVLGAAL